MLPRAITSLCHLAMGYLVAMSALISAGLPLAGAAMWIVYELSEDRYLRDRAYRDILEAVLGWGVGVVSILLWRWL